MMLTAKIRISHQDMARLRNLVRRISTAAYAHSETLIKLQDVLDSAVMVETLPGDVVALGSKVLLQDLDSNRKSIYTLSLPSEANISEGTISILAPLGAAILGLKVGEVFEFAPPSGIRTLRLERILTQPEGFPYGAEPSSHPNSNQAAHPLHPTHVAPPSSLHRRQAKKRKSADGYRETRPNTRSK